MQSFWVKRDATVGRDSLGTQGRRWCDNISGSLPPLTPNAKWSAAAGPHLVVRGELDAGEGGDAVEQQVGGLLEAAVGDEVHGLVDLQPVPAVPVPALIGNGKARDQQLPSSKHAQLPDCHMSCDEGKIGDMRDQWLNKTIIWMYVLDEASWRTKDEHRSGRWTKEMMSE